MSQAFEYRFRVTLHDVDAAGVLFFAQLFRHAHDAYESWMSSLGFPLDEMIRQGIIGLPVVHAEADYRKPLRHGDAIRVKLAVAEIGARRFSIEYRFERAPGEPAASARTIHVCTDHREGASGALPDDLAAALRSQLPGG